MDTRKHKKFYKKDLSSLTLQDFKEFYTSIPDAQWQIGGFGNKDKGKCCALGHLGLAKLELEDDRRKAGARRRILEMLVARKLGHISIPRVNDGTCSGYQQKTPRARILALINKAMKG